MVTEDELTQLREELRGAVENWEERRSARDDSCTDELGEDDQDGQDDLGSEDEDGQSGDDDQSARDDFELREALFEAQLRLEGAVGDLVDRARLLADELSALVPLLADGVDALIEIQKDSAEQAELTSRHGDMAGATYDQDERIDVLEDAEYQLGSSAEAFVEALDAIENR